MADIVLFQPKVGHWEDYNKSVMLPLALLHAARIVAQDHKVVVVDQRLDSDWKNTLRKELRKQPLCMGTTSMTGPQIRCALEASKIAKSFDTPVVWGGPHPTLLPVETLQSFYIDAVVVGEGEETFNELCLKLEKRKCLDGVKGAVFKKGAKVIRNPPREFVDLNKLPELPYWILDVKDYLFKNKGRKFLSLETSRGCVNNCTFCYNPYVFKRRWRALTIDKMVEVTREVVEKYGATGIHFMDDNFVVDIGRMKGYSQKLIEERIDVKWLCQGLHINAVSKLDDSEFAAVLRAGLFSGNFGVESGSDAILKRINKNLTREQVIQFNRRIKEFDFEPRYNLIVGFPGETLDDVKLTSSIADILIRENPNAKLSHISIYAPYPGSSMYLDAVKNGFEPPKDLMAWSAFSWDKIDLPWMDDNKKTSFKGMYLCSQVLGKKISDSELLPNHIRLLAYLYRPIASFRMNRFFFDFMPELMLKDLVIK